MFRIKAGDHESQNLFIENEDFVTTSSDCGVIEFILRVARQKYCYFIRVLIDNEVEGNEEFTVQLTANHPLVNVQSNVATVTIVDDTRSSTTPATHIGNTAPTPRSVINSGSSTPITPTASTPVTLVDTGRAPGIH